MSRILPPHPEALSAMGVLVVAAPPRAPEPLVARGAIDQAVLDIRRRRLDVRAPRGTYSHACGETFTNAAAAFGHLALCRRTE